MIPNIQKSNNRYRGPQESKKQHDFYVQAKKNLKDISEAYEVIAPIVLGDVSNDIKEDILYIENKIKLIESYIASELGGA